MKYFLALMVFSTWHLVANATHPNSDDVSYGGTGCPEGTATISFDSENNLVVTPRDYSASLSGNKIFLRKRIDEIVWPFTLSRRGYAAWLSSKDFARKTCGIAWPFVGRPGLKINLGVATMSGFVNLDSSTKSRIAGENFLSGQRGPRVVSSIEGPKSTDFSLSIAPSGPGECGQSVIIRLNTSVELEGSAGKRADVTVDSITIAYPTFTKCHQLSRL